MKNAMKPPSTRDFFQSSYLLSKQRIWYFRRVRILKITIIPKLVSAMLRELTKLMIKSTISTG